jgi:hypothetical protein
LNADTSGVCILDRDRITLAGVYKRSFVAGLAIALFPFLPQILSQIPAIWKDVGMAIALLMSVALVFFAKKTGSRAALLLSPIFLFTVLQRD